MGIAELTSTYLLKLWLQIDCHMPLRLFGFLDVASSCAIAGLTNRATAITFRDAVPVASSDGRLQHFQN